MLPGGTWVGCWGVAGSLWETPALGGMLRASRTPHRFPLALLGRGCHRQALVIVKTSHAGAPFPFRKPERTTSR